MIRSRQFKGILILGVAVMMASTTYTIAGASSHGKGHGSHFNSHFADMDTNGDKQLSYEEFKTIFPATNQTAFDRIDTDSDGALSHGEWKQFKEMHKGMGKHHVKQRPHPEKMPKPSSFNAHFPDMDADNDGQVDMDEFKKHFQGQADPDKVFKAIDLDANGSIDHDEWHEFKSAHGLKHSDN